MYIFCKDRKTIVNDANVFQFLIKYDAPFSVVASCPDEFIIVGKYKTEKEARVALFGIFAAKQVGKKCYMMPIEIELSEGEG